MKTLCIGFSFQDKQPAADAKPKKVKEPTFFQLSNPSRLIPTQSRYVSLQEEQRYVPICRKTRPAGIVMLLDTDPSAPETVEKGTSSNLI